MDAACCVTTFCQCSLANCDASCALIDTISLCNCMLYTHLLEKVQVVGLLCVDA